VLSEKKKKAPTWPQATLFFGLARIHTICVHLQMVVWRSRKT